MTAVAEGRPLLRQESLPSGVSSATEKDGNAIFEAAKGGVLATILVSVYLYLHYCNHSITVNRYIMWACGVEWRD
jgi:hypothetical protein